MGFFDKEKQIVDLEKKEAFITFFCKGQEYAVPTSIVSEITGLKALMPLPDKSGLIAGVMEHKGLPYTVEDMSARLLGEKAELTETSCVIFVKDSNGVKSGCLADRSGDIIKIDETLCKERVMDSFRLFHIGSRNILIPDIGMFYINKKDCCEPEL